MLDAPQLLQSSPLASGIAKTNIAVDAALEKSELEKSKF
jgi:hypothetical protein